MSVLILAFSRILKMEFVILNFPMNKNNGFYDTAFLVKKKKKKLAKCLWVSLLLNLHETSFVY
jgi:hypothetical protein